MYKIIFILILSILTVGCMERSVPTINIEKEGVFDWYNKEPCKIVYTSNGDVTKLLGEIKL